MTNLKQCILITGGAGFIGSHTADALAKKGYRIRVLDNLQSEVHKRRWPQYILKKGYELIEGDVRKKKDWVAATKNVDAVFHLAAYQDQRPDFSTFFDTNTTSTALLYEVILEKKLPIKKVVIASSQFVYGDGQYKCKHSGKSFFPELRSENQLKNERWEIYCSHNTPALFIAFGEDQPVTPTNSYGISKYASEMFAMRIGKTYNIPTVSLRYSIVQGPRQSPHNLYSGALRIFTIQAISGEPITVYEDGNQKRDFVNVEDVANANCFVLQNPKADFRIFNVGGGKAYSVIDFAQAVKQITCSASPIVVKGCRRTDTRHAVSNIAKLKKLGWKPQHTPKKSIQDYIEWLKKEHGHIKKQKSHSFY